MSTIYWWRILEAQFWNPAQQNRHWRWHVRLGLDSTRDSVWYGFWKSQRGAAFFDISLQFDGPKLSRRNGKERKIEGGSEGERQLEKNVKQQHICNILTSRQKWLSAAQTMFAKQAHVEPPSSVVELSVQFSRSCSLRLRLHLHLSRSLSLWHIPCWRRTTWLRTAAVSASPTANGLRASLWCDCDCSSDGGAVRRRQPFGRGCYINIFIFVWHRNVAAWHIYQKMPYWHLQATWTGLAVQQRRFFFVPLSFTSSSKLINFICCQERLLLL